uniref:Uncharacterized protein n=1 Tax=viral metagenome TaxID=1070528 RepID=A0A6M3JUI5_9ZZZZ
MTKTLASLRQGLSEWVGDWWSGTVDSGEKNFLNDAALADKRDQANSGQWVLFVSGTTSGTDDGQIRLIDSYSDEDNKYEIRWRRPLSADLVAAVVYEIHRYHPDDIKRALNFARLSAYPYIYRFIDDSTTYVQESQREYALPSSMEGSPDEVYITDTITINDEILENNGFEDWDSSSDPADWGTATNLTLAQETTFVWEGNNSCKCTSTAAAGSLPQTISSASAYAGQKLTFSAPVYANSATRIRLSIYDGTNTTYSSYHGGSGWEELTVSATMPASPSELTVKVEVAAGTAMVFYVDGACHLWASRRKPSGTPQPILNYRVNGTLLELPHCPATGRFIRVVGKGLLSSVSSDTDEMEVSDPQTFILYAASYLYLLEQSAARKPTDSTEIYKEIGRTQARLAQLKRECGMESKAQLRISPDWGV